MSQNSELHKASKHFKHGFKALQRHIAVEVFPAVDKAYSERAEDAKEAFNDLADKFSDLFTIPTSKTDENSSDATDSKPKV